MSNTHEIILAGFGGQGILFAGKLLAYAGMLEEKEVSWLPSYGPEMRGGTCNCSVIVSDKPIGSPLVLAPDIMCAMNLPSLDKFEKSAAVGAKIFVDSTLIERKTERTDVQTYYVPATRMADENGMSKLANVILCGKILRETGLVSIGIMDATMKKIVPAKKPELFDMNMKMLMLGYNA